MERPSTSRVAVGAAGVGAASELGVRAAMVATEAVAAGPRAPVRWVVRADNLQAAAGEVRAVQARHQTKVRAPRAARVAMGT